jgi:hypothetical protein
MFNISLYKQFESCKINDLFFNKGYIRSTNLSDIKVLDLKSSVSPVISKSTYFLNIKKSRFSTTKLRNSFILNWVGNLNDIGCFDTNKLYNSIKLVSSTKVSLFIVLPIKGGFICFSSGLFGFMPRKHLKFLLIKTFLELRKKLLIYIQQSEYSIVPVFLKLSNLSGLYRFSFLFLKLSIMYKSGKQKYNKKLKKSRVKKRMNILFLLQLKKKNSQTFF